MGKLRLLIFFTLPLLLLLSANAVFSQEALIFHPTDGSGAKSFAFEDIRRITFSGDNMSILLFDGSVAGYSIDKIAKLSFGDKISAGVNAPLVSKWDAIVSVTPAGDAEVVTLGIEPVGIRSLTLYSIDGRMISKLRCTGVETQCIMPLQNKTSGIYLLHIETTQGTVVKKIIKK
jgi:hypothetical protein